MNNLIFLLFYAAHIDTSISDAEKEKIMEHLHSQEDWPQLLKTFEKESDLHAQRITDILQDASPSQKEKYLQEIRNLMQADGQISSTELYLLNLIKKY